MLFNAGYNEQAFFPKPWKKLGADQSCRFRENAKNAPLIPKMTSPSRRLS